ncbi:hypothetical protein B9479_007844 [Cryptococcus floricola]|uniref:Major facilitator superfamily (MFS) profile domain-containing protein n=1 Tax=Cryptococcus floricola TaxID=2591691 RepID=A0A5D3AKU2_9TREE|nr:hypothetical protein B9479_007844 [Cryptococcus floricola]
MVSPHAKEETPIASRDNSFKSLSALPSDEDDDVERKHTDPYPVNTLTSHQPAPDGKDHLPNSGSDLEKPQQRPEAAMGDAILRFLGVRKRLPEDHPDAIATQYSELWDSDKVEEYKKLYIRDDWENIEAFDPSFRWTIKEEKQTRRAVDWKIMLWVCIMFSALNIDRGNLSNATSDNILDDLNISTDDYNLGVTISKVGFLIAELPSQLISKRLGPDVWIPIQIIIFSVLSGAQFWLKGRASFLALRFLIAVFQGGFIPDTILYLSYFYPSRRLPIRLAFYWMSSSFVDIFVGFCAVGLLKMRGVLGYAGWRWLFLIEGLFTLLIGIASFFLMPTAPAKTKSWHHPKGYFTDKQVKIIVNSVIRDDPGKASMHNRQPLSVKSIWRCCLDYDLYPLYALGLMFGIPKYPVAQYLSLSFRQLGFNVIETNLLTIPSTVCGLLTQLGITVLSELVNNRSFVASAEDLWLLPCFIALVTLAEPVNPWSYFAVATVLLSYPYTHAIQVAWCSRNSGSVEMRTVSASLYNMFVQVSAMIGANVYQAKDKPRYYKANKILIGIIVFNCVVLYPGTYFYYKWRNGQKAKVWDTMSDESRKEYLAITEDKGNKRLDFRFAL